MKCIIIYRSKTGFTKRYAHWLAESLSCEAVAYEDRDKADLEQCDMIIYGGSIHAGIIGGVKWFKERTAGMDGVEKAVFAVGAMPEGSPEIDEMIHANFTEEERKEIKVFYLQGGLDYEKMGLKDRLMMKAFTGMLKKKAATEEEKKMAQTISASYDISDRSFLDPVICYVQNVRKTHRKPQQNG